VALPEGETPWRPGGGSRCGWRGLSCLLARASPDSWPAGLRGRAGRSLRLARVHVCAAPLGRAWERTPALPDPGMIRGIVPGFHRIYVGWPPWSWRCRRPGSVVPGSRDPAATPVAGERVIAADGRLLVDIVSYPAK